MNEPAGNVTIKERALSTLDVTVLFQVVHEMLRRVGPHRHPVQFMVTVGEIHHVLLIGAPAVKPAALTQETYKLGRVGGGNPAAIRQNIYNPQIQISAESETKRSIFREKDKTKRSKKESAQHSKSRNKSFVMTSVSAL